MVDEDAVRVTVIPARWLPRQRKRGLYRQQDGRTAVAGCFDRKGRRKGIGQPPLGPHLPTLGTCITAGHIIQW